MGRGVARLSPSSKHFLSLGGYLLGAHIGGPQTLHFDCPGLMFTLLATSHVFDDCFEEAEGRHKDESLNACAGSQSILLASSQFQWTSIHFNGPQSIPTKRAKS